MGKKSVVATIFAATSLFILIIDSKRALSGAQEGVLVCIQTVIPSLLPFLFFSTLLTEGMQSTGVFILKPLRWLWRIPRGTEDILLVGLLGGYPSGAYCVSSAFEQGRISRQNAQRMLSFCNNCGPAFIFGIVGSFFDKAWQVWLIWIIHLLSSSAVSWLYPCSEDGIPAQTCSKIRPQQILKRSISVLSQICGWVILFRMLITFIDAWFGFYLSTSANTVIYALLELTNGCLSLHLITDESLRFILCSAMLAMGGFCVAMQTGSIISHKLELSSYYLGKLLQTACSVILSTIVCFLFMQAKLHYMFPLLISIFLIVFVVFVGKLKNYSRFFPHVVV